MNNTPLSKNKIANRNGITLVELLTVVTLMTILTALIIPRIRTVNKDRSIREASRVVAAAFASASNRGATDGAGGIQIVRNPNFVARTQAGNNILFASTRIYTMKNLPDYSGEDNTAMATVALVPNPDKNDIEELQVTIPAPTGTDVVRINDQIRFGRIPFRITSEPVEENGELTFFIDFDDDEVGDNDVQAGPDFYTGRPAPMGGRFVIQRQPRRLESSAIDLPPGYIIDLRYSGPLDLGDGDGDGVDEGEDVDIDSYTKFSLVDDNDPDTPNTIEIFFDESAGISNVSYDGRSVLFGNTLFLHITEYDPGEISGGPSASADAKTILSRDEALWVTVNNISGSANVGYNAPPALSTIAPFGLIEQSRTLSRTRTTAAQ